MENTEHKPTSEMWREQFAAYTARKLDRARNAEIPGYKTIEDHTSEFPNLDEIGNDWTRKMFDGEFFLSQPKQHKHVLNTVFVQTLDGNTGADNPGDLGGGETDYQLIYEGLSRVAAHAVMAGANTIRGSGILLSVWHPELIALRESLGLPRHPAQIIVSESGRIDLDSEMMFNVPEVPVFLLTSNKGAQSLAQQAASRPWVKVQCVGDTTDLPSLLHWVATEHGHERISVIGGRTLTTGLIDSGLVRDLYLTTSNIRGGEPNTPYYTGGKPPQMQLVTRKEGRGAETGVRFEHFVV